MMKTVFYQFIKVFHNTNIFITVPFSISRFIVMCLTIL